ncbi:hypothetical protein BBP40_004304 [Aspergillus hancockii]|nr:hypothetical protein BBP40_004304 [Aspergillus hancockii]
MSDKYSAASFEEYAHDGNNFGLFFASDVDLHLPSMAWLENELREMDTQAEDRSHDDSHGIARTDPLTLCCSVQCGAGQLAGNSTAPLQEWRQNRSQQLRDAGPFRIPSTPEHQNGAVNGTPHESTRFPRRKRRQPVRMPQYIDSSTKKWSWLASLRE